MNKMQKLVDYFVVVGYEHHQSEIIGNNVRIIGDDSDYYYQSLSSGQLRTKQPFMQG